MFTRIFALTFALLTITAQAHAATIEVLDLHFNLQVPSNFFAPPNSELQFLSGDLDAVRINDPYVESHVGGPYFVSGNNFALGSYLTSYPLFDFGLGRGTAGYLEVVGNAGSPPINIQILFYFNVANISNPTFESFTLNGISPVGGDITITNEVINPTPLPAALPLFGSGIIALAGLAACRRRGEVSQ